MTALDTDNQSKTYGMIFRFIGNKLSMISSTNKCVSAPKHLRKELLIFFGKVKLGLVTAWEEDDE